MSATKNRIIQTALILFNKHGSHRITTNHIAEEMGISPGNLYYHFRNKEEIIREIFGQIIIDFGVQWAPQSFQNLEKDDLLKRYRQNCALFYRYRFFYLEISSLLMNDPLLHKQYIKNQENRFNQIKNFVSILISLKIIIKSSVKEIESLITGTWMIFEYWPTFLTASNRKVTPESIEECIIHIFHVIKAYLNKDAKNAFSEFITTHYSE